MLATMPEPTKRKVSAEAFRWLVAKKAYEIWKHEEYYRRNQDWKDAVDEFKKSLFICPHVTLDDALVRPIAQRLHDERKQPRMDSDWRQAELLIVHYYEVL
jgi:hypothetical protein